MDAFLISYPKSGRTWLQRIIVEALIEEDHIQEEVKDIYDLHRYVEHFPRIVATHAGACWEENLKVLNADQITKYDDSKFLPKKVIFMCRDPRDVMVSQFYHVKYRTRIPGISKEDLISGEIVGLKKQIAFINKWYNYLASYPETIHLVTYEALHSQTLMSVRKVLKFLDIQCSEENLVLGIQKASFSNMRSKESAETLTPWNYTPNTGNQQSYHARKGEMGEFNDFFSKDEILEINDIISNQLHPDLINLWGI